MSDTLDRASTRPPIAGPVNREDFLAQQVRYRRETWRISALCALAILAMGVPLSVLISPLVWALVILGADIANLISPVPDLFSLAFDGLDRVLGSSRPAPTGDLIWLAAALILPGIAFMGVAWLLVRALLFRAGSAGFLRSLGARPPRADDFEEQQLGNVVEEMAIAAGVSAPRVYLLDTAAVNAGVVGSGPDDAVLVVSRGLLAGLDRDETEGVIGHLVGSVGNGDLRASMTILSVVQTLGLVSMLLGAPTGRTARAGVGHLVRLMLGRGRSRADAAAEVENLLVASAAEGTELSERGSSGQTRLRDVIELPFLMGAAAFWINQKIFLWLLTGPLVAWSWRTRRYLADATAVELTRQPDGLARALARLAMQNDVIPGASWSSHLFIIGRAAARDGRTMARHGGLGDVRWAPPSSADAAFVPAPASERSKASDNPIDSIVTFDPPLRRRLEHLRAAGSTVPLPDRRAMSATARVIVVAVLGPLLTLVFGALLGVAVALVFVTLLIYMLFLLPMVGLAHVLLHGAMLHVLRRAALPVPFSRRVISQPARGYSCSCTRSTCGASGRRPSSLPPS